MNKRSSPIATTDFSLGACAPKPSNSQIDLATGAVDSGAVGSALSGGSTIGTLAGAGAAAGSHEIGTRMN